MTSDPAPLRELFVWIWLPGAAAPVVAGRIERVGDTYQFNYGKTYLNRKDAIAIYKAELPLKSGDQRPLAGLTMANCLRDGAPDAWGRRVIINRLTGLKGDGARDVELDELTYMIESGSDRIGALDFQASATDYVPRDPTNATLAELSEASERVERGVPLTPALDRALYHGSSIGGARPKALLESDTQKFIAKFSATNDTYSVVKGEFVAMRLAKLCGLNVAPVELTAAAGKDVLLVERFDRVHGAAGWQRRAMVSALTLFELDELMARHASYHELADKVRAGFTAPRDTLRELYGRMVFNVLTGNTDDHARNHAAFWDGKTLSLTPAYDICPQPRTGREANQAIKISGNDRRSQLSVCLEAANAFLMSDTHARDLIAHQIETINAHWQTVCDEARLNEVDRAFFWGRQFLNPYAFEGVGDIFGGEGDQQV